MVRKKIAVTTKEEIGITEEQTIEMADFRKHEIIRDNPVLQPENFPNEEEYRKALLEQYKNLRQTEYNYIVANECAKVYNVTCDGRKKGIPENQGIWNGYKNKGIEVSDTAVVRAPIITKAGGENPDYMCRHQNLDKEGNVKSTGAYSCAITATAIQSQVSAKMGYDGENNLIQPSKETSYTSARNAATGVPPQYQLKNNGKTLNQRIAAGEIGVGDEVSLITGQASNTRSGCHTVTIAGINRDENGKITGYTIQANNICKLQTYDINDRDTKSLGNRVVNNAVKTHQWAEDRIKEETQKLENLSTEELAATINQQRLKDYQVIDGLQATEDYAVTHRKSNGKQYITDIAEQYQKDLHSKEKEFRTPVPEQTETAQQTPIAPQTETQQQTPVTTQTEPVKVANDNRETLHTELRKQQGEPVADTKSDIKQARFEKVVDSHTIAQQQDNLPVKESMKEEAEKHGISVKMSTETNTPVFIAANTQKEPEQKQTQPITMSVQQMAALLEARKKR